MYISYRYEVVQKLIANVFCCCGCWQQASDRVSQNLHGAPHVSMATPSNSGPNSRPPAV